jgi:hypothetical protein
MGVRRTDQLQVRADCRSHSTSWKYRDTKATKAKLRLVHSGANSMWASQNQLSSSPESLTSAGLHALLQRELCSKPNSAVEIPFFEAIETHEQSLEKCGGRRCRSAVSELEKLCKQRHPTHSVCQPGYRRQKVGCLSDISIFLVTPILSH